MADTNQLLEILQADVLAVLQSTPALDYATVIADNEGDIEAKVAKALATLTETGGRKGLAVVVLLPEVIAAEANIPGPPFVVKVEIRTLENVLFNRAAASGTLVRSSQAALSVLSALHLRHLGHCLLAAEKDPVAPVEVKKGHVSHSVTLTARFSGFVTSKPLGVEASMSEEIAAVPNSLTTAFSGANNDLKFTQVGTGTAPMIKFRMEEFLEGQNAAPVAIRNNEITVTVIRNSGTCSATAEDVKSLIMASSPAMAMVSVAHAAGNNGTGLVCQPTDWDISFGPTSLAGASAAVPAALTLTCASASSTIRYTTDGSYPSPSKTRYTAPITGLAAGTVVRAAAYVSGQAPGDVLELTITA